MKRLNRNMCTRLSLMGVSAVIAFSGCNLKKTTPTGVTTSGISVTTYHNDQARSGQNLNETILNPSNVNTSTFGKLAALKVDDQIYGQPLVASSIQTSDGNQHNLVYVVTESDSVYAFDEDAATASSDLATNSAVGSVWERHFLTDNCPSGKTCSAVTPATTGAPNIAPFAGITATPVIDLESGTIFVIAMDIESGTVFWKLHSLSLATGEEQPNSPVIISGTAPVGPNLAGAPAPGSVATPSDVKNGQITFQAQYQLARAGLVLLNGMVYVSFSSWNDREPCHGWMFGYDVSSLKQMSTFISTPSTGTGTFWMAGGAPAIDDAGNIFAATGNGDKAYLATATAPDFADSVLKLAPGTLELEDHFTPFNWQTLAIGDVDLGSGGVLLLPDSAGSAATPHLMIAGGKEGTIFLLNRDALGGVSPDLATETKTIVQDIVGFIPGGKNAGAGLYGTPSYFNGNVYFMPQASVLTAIPVANGQLNTNAAMKSTVTEKFRGSTVSISASDVNNSNSDGIVWYVDPSAYTYNSAGVATSDGPAILMAFNAKDLTPLYQSPGITLSYPSTGANDNPDYAGGVVKFSVPTVANGLVFIGTEGTCWASNTCLSPSTPMTPGQNGELSIYGLRDRTKPTPVGTPSDTAAASFPASFPASMDNSSRSFASISMQSPATKSVMGKAVPWLDQIIADKKSQCFLSSPIDGFFR